MEKQIALLNESNEAINIVVVTDNDEETMNMVLESSGASSYLDLNYKPYPFGYPEGTFTWNEQDQRWSVVLPVSEE